MSNVMPKARSNGFPFQTREGNIVHIQTKFQGTVTTFDCQSSWPNFICSEYQTGKVCGGDSGGAVVADLNEDGTWLLYGIVSFATGCGTSSGYDGYVDVATWTDTILPMIVYD